MIYQGFVGPSYTSQSVNAACQRCVNLYVEAIEVPGEKSRFVLYPTPGFTTFASPAQSPNRGLFAHGSRLFTAAGNTLYEVAEDAALTNRGAIAVNSNPCTFATNGDAGDQVLISSGDLGYLFNLNTNVLTTPLASGSRMVDLLDGYFLSLNDTTSTLRISDLLDGTTWSATQIAQRTAGADPWRAMIVAFRQIWLFGEKTSEVWWNAGTFPFPFEPIAGAFFHIGIASASTLKRLGQAVVWLGQNEQGGAMVYRAQSFVPQRISTHAVEYAMQGYDTVTDAEAYTYQDQGHDFYVLSFPSAGHTWVYDDATGLWHERMFWNRTQGVEEAYRIRSFARQFGQSFVGDTQTGTIYTQSIGTFTDVDGNGPRRIRRAPHISSKQQWIYHKSIQIDFETGVGLTSGQGSAPVAILRWSNDGGHTFGADHDLDLGAIGEYTARAHLDRLGRSRDRVYEVVITDPVGCRLTGAYLDVEVGLH